MGNLATWWVRVYVMASAYTRWWWFFFGKHMSGKKKWKESEKAMKMSCIRNHLSFVLSLSFLLGLISPLNDYKLLMALFPPHLTPLPLSTEQMKTFFFSHEYLQILLVLKLIIQTLFNERERASNMSKIKINSLCCLSLLEAFYSHHL